MKKSEKRLLFLLLGLALLGAVVVCSDIYIDKRDALMQKQADLENEWVEIETLFEEKKAWDIKGDWLENNQPDFTTNQAVSQAIFERAEKPSFTGVTNSRLTLVPVSETEHYTEVGVWFTAEGELGKICRWLYDNTPPSSFRVIRNLKFTPSPEDPRILNARIELLRWYAPAGS